MTLRKQLLPALVITSILGGCSVPASISQKVPFLASQISPEVATQAGQLVGSNPAVIVGDDYSDVIADREVKYTDLGFEPAELEISPNTRVVFLNQSADRLWVQSTQPFYSFKPRFDAGAGVKAGGWTSIIFNQPGTWRYQNYLNPSQKGSITVIDVVE